MILNKKVVRSVKKNLSFHVVVSFLMIITAAMLIGAFTTAKTMANMVEGIDQTLSVEDAQFVTDRKITDADLRAYEEKYDLILEPQYYTDILYENAKTYGEEISNEGSGERKNTNATIRVFRNNEKLNLAWIFETQDGIHKQVESGNPEDGEIFLTKRFAEAKGIKIGTVLEVGNERLRVSGFAMRPDYANTLKDLSETIGDFNKFSIGIINADTYEKAFGSGQTSIPAYYSVCYRDARQTNAFRQQLYSEYHPMDYFQADANGRIVLLRSEVPMLREEFGTYSVILFIFVMVLIGFMISRIIRKEAANIGTLKALGYRESELLRHYVLYAVGPTIFGCIVGSLISIPFSKAFCAFFFGDVDAFPYRVSFDLGVILIALIVPVFLNSVISALVVSRLLKKDAVYLMKRENAGRKNANLLKGCTKFKFKTLYMLRILLGNPMRTGVYILGMTLASMIILLGGMCRDSQKNVLDTVLPEMMGEARYETGLITFRSGKIENGETLIDVMFEIPGTSNAFNLVGYDEDNTLLKRKTLSGEPIIYGKYYMTSGLAKQYGIQSGDTFSFVHRITGEETSVEIADIIDNDALTLVITSKKKAADIVGVTEEEYNNILSSVPVEVPEEEILKVADFDSYKESFEQMLRNTKIVYTILLAAGMIICILIVNLLSGMIIDENGRNISMLKVLGYQEREIRDIVLRPNHFLLPCCFALSIPLTAYMTGILMAGSAQTTGIWIDVTIKPTTLILYFLIVLVSYYISLLLTSRRLDKVSMAESLKQED